MRRLIWLPLGGFLLIAGATIAAAAPTVTPTANAPWLTPRRRLLRPLPRLQPGRGTSRISSRPSWAALTTAC